jgi:hypothetical protein
MLSGAVATARKPSRHLHTRTNRGLFGILAVILNRNYIGADLLDPKWISINRGCEVRWSANSAAVKLGRRGGKVAARNRTAQERAEQARKAANTRWAKRPSLVFPGTGAWLATEMPLVHERSQISRCTPG